MNDGNAIDVSLNIRSNDPDILNTYRSESAMYSALKGTRSYGVKNPSNISRIRSIIDTKKKYKIWYGYNENGYVWEIHIDEPYS